MLRILATIFAFTQSSGAAAAADAPEHLQLKEFNARYGSQILALTCSEANWQAYATWARQTGFIDINRSVDIDMEVDRQSQAIRIKNDTFRVLKTKASSTNHLEMRFNGKTYVGEDACALMVAAFPVEKTKHSLMEWILPSANAQAVQAVREARGVDHAEATLGGALITLSVVGWALGWTGFGAVGAPIVGSIGYYLSNEAYSALKTKKVFEDVLNHHYDVSCTGSLVTIDNGKTQILITKPNEAKHVPLSVQVVSDGKVVLNDSDSMNAPQSHHVLYNLTSQCPGQVSPQQETAAANEAVHRASQNMQALGGNGATPPSAPGDSAN